MVKKQLAKGAEDKPAPRAGDSGEARDGGAVASRRNAAQSEGQETGDRTVSSTTTSTTCAKNIFEKFMAGRRSPRKCSNSPRGHKSSSAPEDTWEARSSSEERQQMSIATAVKALRGLTGKVSDTSGKARASRKDGAKKDSAKKDSAKNSRNASPSSSTSPPKCATNSPKRQSPRRMAEKMSPPTGATVQRLTPKTKKSPSSRPGSDSSQSPFSCRHGRSPRRAGGSSGFNSSDSPGSREHSPRERKRGAQGAGKTYAVGASSEQEHTIRILSSSTRGSRLVHVEQQQRSPVCAVRKLFPDTHPHPQPDDALSGKSASTASVNKLPKCSVSSSSVDETNSDKHAEKTASVSSSSSSSLCLTGVNSRLKKSGISNPDESLLCAMLVGGNEVTQSYVKSRDQQNLHGHTALSECSDSMDWKPSEGSYLNDSFFDDDATGDASEEKPYELPDLSQLPPLRKPNLAVLELMTSETSSPARPCQMVSSGHKRKTSGLLELISKISERLPSSNDACKTAVSDAQKLLSQYDGEGSSDVHTITRETDQLSSPATDRDEAHDQTVSSTSPHASHSSEAGESRDVIEERDADADMSPKSGEAAVGARVIPPEVAAETPDSPSSLGELDPTQMTQAATQAVQHHLVKAPDPHARKSSPVVPPSHQNAAPSAKPPQPGLSGVSGPAALVSESEDSCKPGPSGRGCGSQSQTRSFFSRIASPAKPHWRPKMESTSSTGRPGWSRWHKVIDPQPISVLGRPEKSSTRQSAFVSKHLDTYLNQSCNRYVVPACQESPLGRILQEEGHVKDYSQLHRQISGEDETDRPGQEAGDKSDDDDAEEEDRDSEAARKLDPDFDEVEGVVFVSFPSEIGVKAHMTLEKSRQWEGGSLAYLNMAKFHAFEESRRKEGKVRRESQGLRGQHMKWRRYQRLYRNELRRLYDENNKDAPWPLAKLPEKTSDIHKIKNWKNKIPDLKTEEMEALELLGEEEERIKRKRKTYVFSSKKKKTKRSLGSPETLKREYVDEEDGDDDDEEGEEDDAYGVPIPIDEDQYMKDVNSSIEELRVKEKGLKQCKGIFTRFKMGPEDRHIFKKLGGWNTRFRRFRRMPQAMKEGDGPIRLPRKRAPKKDRDRLRFELKNVTAALAFNALTALCVDANAEGWRLPAAKDAGSHSNAVKAEGGGDFVDLTGGESPGDVNSKKLDCDKPGCRYGCICHLCVPSTESDETDQAQTPVLSRRTCDKEYCRLGCICESLEKCGARLSQPRVSLQDSGSASLSVSPVCAKPGCVERCVCSPLSKGASRRPETDPQPLTSIKQDTPLSHHHLGKGDPGDQMESSGDELPTLEKTAAPRRQRSTDRYSNLPRRQTSYRIAKNLDAVTRKAMNMWEMSEVYMEQTTSRRKKMADAMPPAVTTSSPCVAPSPPVTSSLSSSSPPVASTSHGNMVTTAVSVNTLPAVMTCLSVPGSLPLVSLSPTTSTAKTSPQVSTASHSSVSKLLQGSSPMIQGSSPMIQGSSPTVQGSLAMVQRSPMVQGSSPVVVSDEEGKADALSKDAGAELTLQSKRLRKKRKSAREEGADSEAPPPKSKMATSSSPVSVITVSDSPESSDPPTTRPPAHQWHSTLICLRANNPTPVSDSDDVMEEDEIKLVEMIFDCPWDRCKENILKAITSNVKRGLYPEPRVLTIGEFRVEILPKASRPSAIPVALRSKLPKYMFPVRVRVTEILKRKGKDSASKPRDILKSEASNPSLSTESSKCVSSEGDRTKPEKLTGETVKTPPAALLTKLMPPTTTPLPPLSSGRLPVQGVAPRPGLHGGGSGSLNDSLLASGGVGGEGVCGGTMGISGLGRLQISHNKPASTLTTAPAQSWQQHLRIQKKDVTPGQDEASSSSGSGEKKKKKKKKKNNSLGDDSLVPDLSNLSVSPRVSQNAPPPPVVATHPPPPFTISTLPQTRTPLREGAGASPVRPTHLTPPGVSSVRATPMAPMFPAPVSRLVHPHSLRPQVLGIPSLPANLSNVKFLQLPGQNNLLQIVPASALGLKPMDNKNVPNFVAVPVSLTSIAQQGLAGKKPGKAPVEGNSKGTPPAAAQEGVCAALAGGNVSVEKEPVLGGEEKSSGVSTAAVSKNDGEGKVVKKKKKRKKKSAEDKDCKGDGVLDSSSSSSSQLLVAGSPSPALSCAGSYPVYSMTNTHGTVPPPPPHPTTPSLLFPPLPFPATSVSTLPSKTDTAASQQQTRPAFMAQHTSFHPPLMVAAGSSLASGSLASGSVVSGSSLASGSVVSSSSLASGSSLSGHPSVRDSVMGAATLTTPVPPLSRSGRDDKPQGAVGSSHNQAPPLPSSSHMGVGADKSGAASFHTPGRSPPPASFLDPRDDCRSSTVSDEDSKGSWLDNVDLSSSEGPQLRRSKRLARSREERLDVGTDPPAPNDVTSHLMKTERTPKERLSHRIMEKQRRDDLKKEYRHMMEVLNEGGASIPTNISQVKLIKKATNLIQFLKHTKRSYLQTKEELKEQQEHLLDCLKRLIDAKLAEGVSQSAIQHLLATVPTPPELLLSSLSPCPLASPSPSLPNPSPSQPLDVPPERSQDSNTEGGKSGYASGTSQEGSDSVSHHQAPPLSLWQRLDLACHPGEEGGRDGDGGGGEEADRPAQGEDDDAAVSGSGEGDPRPDQDRLKSHPCGGSAPSAACDASPPLSHPGCARSEEEGDGGTKTGESRGEPWRMDPNPMPAAHLPGGAQPDPRTAVLPGWSPREDGEDDGVRADPDVTADNDLGLVISSVTSLCNFVDSSADGAKHSDDVS